jgi:prepilin-type processing-associated H-X9-DG protein
MLCPSYSDANLKRAFDNPACEGPGVFERLFPPTQVYATYGIIWVQGATVGSGTQQNPFWHYAGSGPWRGDFVTTRLPAVLRPAETALITDGFTGVTGGKQPGNYGVSVGCDGAEMHQGGTNLIFLDGHAKWIAGNSERYLKQRADGKWFVLYYTYDME